MARDCVFCGIAEGRIPARFVLEDERVVAFHDLSPQAPVHVLVIPKAHVETLSTVDDGPAGSELLASVLQGARRAAAQLGLSRETGWRLVVNCGETAGQSVFHLHAHVLGGRPFGRLG